MSSKVGLEETRQCKSCGTTLAPKPVRDVVQSAGRGGVRRGAGQKPRYCAGCSGRQGQSQRRQASRPCVGCKQQSPTRTCATCQAEKIAARREQRACAVCGKAFECMKASSQKACGAVCGNRLAVQAAKSKVIQRTCEYCGGGFKKKGSKAAGRFCSRPCAFAFQTERARARPARVKPERLVVCAKCGQGFVRKTARQRWCSQACRTVKSARPPRTLSCRQCRASFKVTGQGSPKTCSEQCRKLDRRCAVAKSRHAPWFRKAKRIQKAKRRARERQLPCESVDPIAVFERDGWRCQMCGTETPASLRGRIADDAPELDHVVPLARGGPHTYANVQCACRKCNGLKGDGTTLADANILTGGGLPSSGHPDSEPADASGKLLCNVAMFAQQGSGPWDARAL